MVARNLGSTPLTTAVFENFLQKNVWIQRSSLQTKTVLQTLRKMKSVCFGHVRATKLPPGASFLAHHANMFFRDRLDCTQHAAEDAQRNFATHSFNDMEHPSSSTATRVEKSAATVAVENGLWRRSLC